MSIFSIEEKIILVFEIVVAIAGIVITFISFEGSWVFLQYTGIPCTIISTSMLLVSFQIKEKYKNIEGDLNKERLKSEGLYSKVYKYKTIGELNDIEQKFVKDKDAANKI